MKLDTVSDHYNDNTHPFFVGMIGLFALSVLTFIGLVIYDIIARHVGILVLLTVLTIVGTIGLSWLVGHILIRSRAYVHPKCGCGSRYKYFWTEWRHKKRCLAFKLNGNTK